MLRLTRLFKSSNTRKFSSKFFTDFDEESEIHYPPSRAFVGQVAPTFTAPAVVDGEIKDVNLEDYHGKWTVLFFYPKDFTFVCPTEIIAFSDRAEEFEKINAKLIACSTDTQESHLAWTRLARNQGGLGHMNIPIVADVTKKIAASYGVLNQDVGIALRGLFLINPAGLLEQMTVNNFPVGRSVDETLRLLKAFQYVEKHGEVCPANWQPGGQTMIANPEDSQVYFASGATEDKKNKQLDDSKVVSVTSIKQLEKIMEQKNPTVLEFMAPWCGKCNQIAPFVDNMASKYEQVTILKLDTTIKEISDYKEGLGVTALPTFCFFKNGKPELDMISGYKKRPLEESIQKLM